MSGDQFIVSARGLQALGSLESVRPSSGGAREDPLQRALTINRYHRAAEILEHETLDPELFVTVQDREASLLQSRMASEAAADAATVVRNPLAAGGEEVKFGPGLEDPWGWATSLFDWIDRIHAHPIVRPEDDVQPLPNRARMALLSDWGTGLYGAPVSVETLAGTGPWDVLLHLGDVYYSGTPEEVESRFSSLWPKSAAATHRALNGNHEMYSGGFGYFDSILPDFGQSGSYFAMANDYWLLIGLDTAYVDHDMDQTQVGWLNRLIKDSATRKVLLFSHQQLFSRLGKQGPRLRAALGPVLDAKAITAWYWGHEHDCLLYDAHPDFGLFARCLGNGGVPWPRKEEIKKAEIEHSVADVTWRRFSANSESPSCLALDGPNPYVKGKEAKFLPHGYMTLEFDGPGLIERVHVPDGTEIWQNQIA